MSVVRDYRPDTGLTNGRLGTYLLLAANAMFLGALVSSHVFLRVAAGAEWPKGYTALPWVHGAVAAALLIGAAIFCSPKRGANGPWAAAFLALLGAFALLAGESAVAQAGFKASTNNFYGMYFVLTLVFRVQLVALALVGAWLALTKPRLADGVFDNRVVCLAAACRFLAVAWLAVYAAVYVL